MKVHSTFHTHFPGMTWISGIDQKCPSSIPDHWHHRNTFIAGTPPSKMIFECNVLDIALVSIRTHFLEWLLYKTDLASPASPLCERPRRRWTRWSTTEIRNAISINLTLNELKIQSAALGHFRVLAKTFLAVPQSVGWTTDAVQPGKIKIASGNSSKKYQWNLKKRPNAALPPGVQ